MLLYIATGTESALTATGVGGETAVTPQGRCIHCITYTCSSLYNHFVCKRVFCCILSTDPLSIDSSTHDEFGFGSQTSADIPPHITLSTPTDEGTL